MRSYAATDQRRPRFALHARACRLARPVFCPPDVLSLTDRCIPVIILSCMTNLMSHGQYKYHLGQICLLGMPFRGKNRIFFAGNIIALQHISQHGPSGRDKRLYSLIYVWLGLLPVVFFRRLMGFAAHFLR